MNGLRSKPPPGVAPAQLPAPLIEDIVQGRCLPIIGAGFSLNADVPPGKQMLDWRGVADALDKQTGQNASSPIDSISAYEHAFGRVRLVEELRRLLLVDVAKPGIAHRAFAGLPFDVVCTTNIDFLLEDSYDVEQRRYRGVIDQEQLVTGVQSGDVTVLKLHGDLNHPKQLVLTERNYDGFFEHNPLFATHLASHLIRRTPLFIGYSLDDPDFRQIWQLIGNRLGHLRRKAYAFSVTGELADLARFDRRGVYPIPVSPEAVGDVLAATFERVSVAWEAAVGERSEYADETVRQQMVLPDGTRTRLCFFAVPTDALSVYRDWVYPLARKHGFSPASVGDVIRTDTPLATQEAMIVRCSAIIADVSSSDSFVIQRAAEMALLQDPPPKALVILAMGGDTPLNRLEDVESAHRSDEFVTDVDPRFLGELDDWFARAAERLVPALRLEPERLLGDNDARAALIAAMSLLEVVLRLTLTANAEIADSASEGPSLTKIIAAATREGLLDEAEATEVRGLRTLRNQLVHLPYAGDDEETAAGVRRLVELADAVPKRVRSPIEDPTRLARRRDDG